MIGNNFSIQNSPEYNPLVDQPVASKVMQKKHTLTVEKPHVCPVHHLLEELAELNLAPEDYCAHLLKNFPAYTFYLMANYHQCQAQLVEEEQLVLPSESDELEIEAIDILNSPEKVAKAVEELAFVALKLPEGEEPIELKVAPKWERKIGSKKIRHIKIREQQEPGDISHRMIRNCNVNVTAFNAEEIAEISTVLFKALDIAYKIRTLEQEKKENEDKEKADREEMTTGEKQLRDALIYGQFRRKDGQVDQPKMSMAVGLIAASKASQDKFIEQQRFSARRDEEKLQKQLEEKDEKQAKILKKEIQDCELKREITRRDVKSREIE